MSARPWVISVLSTDYDLHEYRKAVIDKLHDNNVAVSAFELPDFVVETGKHSHNSCIQALDRADIALLVIDKRYGGIYVDDADSLQSITEAEYMTMVKNKKACFVFVSKQTWNERHVYRTNLKNWIKNNSYTEEQVEDAKKNFDAIYKCAYVDSIRTIDFVEQIQRAYSQFASSNWIDQFEGIQDLLDKIEGKLRGHSRFLLESLVTEQKKKIESRHTSTGLSLSLGDVFSRGYYLEPSYDEKSGKLQDKTTLDDKIKDTLLHGASILVYGEAGYGKTTILAKSYLSHVNDFLKTGSYSIPFYLWLKKKNPDYHFDFSSYIAESFVEDWNREPYPYMDLRNIRPFFYFDGFDEIAEKMTPNEVEKISQADMLSYPVLLTCRQQYAFRYINNFNFSDKFNHQIKFNTWDAGMARTYIDNFCSINGKSPDFSATVHKLLAENQALLDILNNPLLITMLLWIIEQNRMQIPETIRTRIELFRSCVNELAKRELARLNQTESLSSELVVVWSYAAWEVYLNNLKNEKSKLSVVIPKLKKSLVEISLIYSEAHFEALFDSANDVIFGTFHEQFLEYLTANTIFLACKNATYPYPEFLSYVMRPEINRYFRAIWYECEEDDKKTIVSNINDQYLSNLGNDSFNAVSKRVHAIYHIGRFDLPEREELMNKAFNIETHISVRLSLFFGAIKMGRLEDEETFFKLLTTNTEYNEANRGYHMAYYSDTIMDDLLPFRDDSQKKWEGTLRAFMRHFNSSELEHYFLRRVDLITMKHLIEIRNEVYPLTQEILDDFEILINSSQFSNKYSDFQKKTEKAFADLQESFKNLSSS